MPRRMIERGVVLPLPVPGVDLPWPSDLLLLVAQHLFPLCEPARRPRHGEQHREEIRRERHRTVDESRVEVDVRVQLARDEVVIRQRDALELQCDLQIPCLLYTSDAADE